MAWTTAAAQAAEPWLNETLIDAARMATDPQEATRLYLSAVSLSRVSQTKSEALSGYIEEVGSFAVKTVYCLSLLAFGVLWRLRDRVARMSSRWPVQITIFWCVYWGFLVIMLFPFEFFRFWFLDRISQRIETGWPRWTQGYLTGQVLPGLAGLVGMILLYALIRRARKGWWLISWAASTLLLAAILFLSPWLQRKSVKVSQNPMLLTIARQLARESGLGRIQVLERADVGPQGRIGASFTGWLGTTSIIVNQASLVRCNEDELRFIIAHETGHLILHHAWAWLAMQSGVLLAFFASTAFVLRFAAARWAVTGIKGPGDVAGLPLLHLCLVVVTFASGPLLNSLARYGENQADHFALEVTRLPDAAASVFLKLSESRDLEPSRVVEAVFFGHPSGRTRIQRAMEWKAQHGQERNSN